MRRIALALGMAILATTTGCSGDGTGPDFEGAELAGQYALDDWGGSQIPIWTGDRHITSGTLTLEGDGQFSLVYTYDTPPGAEDRVDGTWQADTTAHRITFTTDIGASEVEYNFSGAGLDIAPPDGGMVQRWRRIGS